MSFEYDLAIIGSGPAGYSCAIQSASYQKKVVLIEANAQQLGGTWVNTGTLPSKALREAAKAVQRYHSLLGADKKLKPFTQFQMSDLFKYKQQVLDSKNQKLKENLTRKHVEMVRGIGSFIDDHTLQVTDPEGKTRTLTAANILIATGSRPTTPTTFEVDHVNILDYDSLLTSTHIPRRMVVVGNSINAFEYATIFVTLGTRVTLLNESDELLPFLDQDIRTQLLAILEKQSIQVFNGTTIDRIQKNQLRNCTEVGFRCNTSADELRIFEVDQVLYAGGYVPNTDTLNLQAIHLHPDEQGFIAVNEEMKTSIEHIYAAGDVVGYPSLASISFVQGRLAASTMFDSSFIEEGSDTYIPFGIYSVPEIAGIGLSEEEAKRLGFQVETGIASFQQVTQAEYSRNEEGLLKLIFDKTSLQILGVFILGEQAADLIHLGQAVMSMNGDIRYFVQNILNYPTFSEAYQIAALDGLAKIEAE